MDIEFTINDLMNYMIKNDNDILEELGSCNLDVAADLVSIGNRCELEEAYEYIEKYMEEHDYDKFFEDLAYCVIGRKPDDKDHKPNDKEYTSFLDVLEDYYNQIQTIDNHLSLFEFKNMTTRYMYRYSDGLKDRYFFNLNNRSRDHFLEAETFLGLLFGKLNKPIEFDSNKLNENDADKHKSLVNKIKNFANNR